MGETGCEWGLAVLPLFVSRQQPRTRGPTWEVKLYVV